MTGPASGAEDVIETTVVSTTSAAATGVALKNGDRDNDVSSEMLVVAVVGLDLTRPPVPAAVNGAFLPTTACNRAATAAA